MSNRPDPVTGDDVRGLSSATAGLTHSIDEFATKAELKTERDNRRVWVLVGIVVVLIMIGGGLYVRAVANEARAAAHTAQTAVDDLTATRDESRRAVCQSDNHFIENHNKLVDANLQANALLVTAATSSGRERTAEEQARLDAYVQGVTAAYEATRVEPRDCSPEGIEAFYKTGGN